MRHFLILFTVLLTGTLSGQGELRILDTPNALLSSEQLGLEGRLRDPLYAPGKGNLFGFTRQLKDDRFTYLFDITAGRLIPVLPEQGANEDFSFSTHQQKVNHYVDQLSWRPILDHQGRQWFTFISAGEDQNHDVYAGVLEQNGPRYFRLTRHQAIESHPQWSPDGDRIAFVSARSGNGDLYLIEGLNDFIRNPLQSDVGLRRLTTTRYFESSPVWNPNPAVSLLAYIYEEHSAGEKNKVTQIRLLAVDHPDQPAVSVTQEGGTDYSRPYWDPLSDTRLFYVGKELGEKTPARIFLSTIHPLGGQGFQAAPVEGSKAHLFPDMLLKRSPFKVLPGGKLLFTQLNDEKRNHPPVLVALDKWETRRPKPLSYFEDLYQRFPHLTGYDTAGNRLLVATQEGKWFKVYQCTISGVRLNPNAEKDFQLKGPVRVAERSDGNGVWKWLLGTATVGTGAYVTYILWPRKEIGNPPDFPSASQNR